MNDRRKFIIQLSAAALLSSITNYRSFAGKFTKSRLLACVPTTTDYYGQGPFYFENAPVISDTILGEESGAQKIIIEGKVYEKDCSRSVPHALLDLWHANGSGAYDLQGYHFRGKILTNEKGEYTFTTILPGKYLNGRLYRPSHIHIKISAPGFSTLTTQIYFEGDPDIPADAAASINKGDYDASERIVALLPLSDGSLKGKFDIYLSTDITSIQDVISHVDHGIIYHVQTEDKETVHIKYGIFKSGHVTLRVHNAGGTDLGTLAETMQEPGIYEITFLRKMLPSISGIYFMTLHSGSTAIHSKKFLLP